MYIPENLNFDQFNRILIAYLKAGASEKAVNYKEAATRAGIHHTVISLNNKFLVSAGFLTEEKKNFKLTEKGAKYAQTLDWGRLDDAKGLLREILKEYNLVRMILDYVGINKRVSRDDLTTRIGSMIQVPRGDRYTRGITTMIDMLTFSGSLREEEGMLEHVEKPIETTEARPSITETLPSIPQRENIPQIPVVTRPSIPITIAVNVSEATDVKKLKKVIRAIKEELYGEGEKK